MIRTQRFHCMAPGSIPGRGTGILQASQLGQKKNPKTQTWMDLEIIILSEVNQTEKDKYHMILLICGAYKHMILLKKKDTNKFTYKTEIDSKT